MGVFPKRVGGWLVIVVLALAGQAFGQGARAAEELAKLLSKLGPEARVAERLGQEMASQARLAQRVKYQSLCKPEAGFAAEWRPLDRLASGQEVQRRILVVPSMPRPNPDTEVAVEALIETKRATAVENPIHEAGQKLGEESQALKEVRGAEVELCHLTSVAGEAGIARNCSIIGRHGIFAVPKTVAEAGTATKMLATGLSSNCVVRAVEIPAAAAGLFRRPVPIGPYSLWKYAGGVRYAAPGSLSTITGAWKASSSAIGPEILLYGPDLLFWTGVGGCVAIYEYVSSKQE